MSPWHDLITPTPRQVVVYSHRPIDEALAILGELASGRRGAFRAPATRGLRVLDGSVDGRTVTFTAVPASRAAAAESAPESRSLEFRGSIQASPDGSVLAGSVSAAPTAFGLPAAALTMLVALFLAWNGIPLPLVALGVAAWVFLTVVVVGGIGEERLAGADAIERLLEDALA